MLKKEKILYNNRDKKIKISLSSDNDVYGNNQQIDSFIEDEKEKSINPPTDQEVTRFRFNKELETYLGVLFSMNFFDGEYDDPPNLITNYLKAGFTESELYNYEKNIRNSFFILEFFDGYEEKNRRKITTNYYTKIWKKYKYSFEHEAVEIEETNQLKFVTISNNFLKNINSDLFSLYLRVLFYNGKFGHITSFFNEDYKNVSEGEGHLTLKNERPLFFKTHFNKQDRTWWTEKDVLLGYELIHQDFYLNKLNETNINATDLKINYPPKEIFDYRTGTYKNQEDT